MKIILQILLSIAFTLPVKGQGNLIFTRTDSIISLIDKTEKNTDTFQGMLRFDQYEASEYPKGFSKITHKFDHAIWDISRTYYLKDTSLIFVKETMSSYFLKSTQINTYYFENGILLKSIESDTFKNDKSEIQEYLLFDFEKAKRDWQRYIIKHGV